jgi:hypothetical protein
VRSIWKFNLAPGETTLQIPQGAGILTAAEQFGGISMWAAVDPEKPLVDRKFAVFATGQSIETLLGHKFIGTVLLNGGSLVFHVFERPRGLVPV